MSAIVDGSSAFPHLPYVTDSKNWSDGSKGMSLRDWLASNEKINDSENFAWEICEALAGKRPDKDRKVDPTAWEIWQAMWQAKVRYIRADAMLAARKEAQP